MSDIKDALFAAAIESKIEVDPGLDEVAIAKYLVEEHNWDSLDMVEATMDCDEDMTNAFFDELAEALK
jgi:acyl carrier protein